MMIRIHTDKFRLRLYLPRAVLPFALRLAARTDGDADETQRQFMLALADAIGKTHWRRYRKLELVDLSVSDGTEITVRM